MRECVACEDAPHSALPARRNRLWQGMFYAFGFPAVTAGLVGTGYADTNPALEEVQVLERRRESYVEDASSIGKLTESLLNTPQTITALSEELLEDRGAMSLDDALRFVPGITLGAGEFSWQGNNPTIRGFSARNDMFIDGVRDLGNYARDPFNLESVEVLQGPSSMIFGRGSTGGVINQNTKKPIQETLRKLHINVGNASTMRVTADFNQPLDIAEQSAVRVNLLYHDAGVPGRDTIESKRTGIAPSLSLGLGSATTLTLALMKLDSDGIPDYGLPWVGGEPAKVRRGNYYGFEDDYLETESEVGTATLDHFFSERVSLNAVVRYADYGRRSRITEPQVDASVGADVPPETVTTHRLMFFGESDETLFQSQVNLRAEFETAGWAHTLVTGLEFANETSDPAFGFAGVTPFFDYDLPVPTTNLAHPSGTFTGTGARRLQSDTESDTLSAFVLDTVELNERWQLSAGLRWDRFETDYLEYRYDETGAETGRNHYESDDREPSYRVALIHKPVPEGTVYLAWGTSFNPASEGVSFISSGRGLTTSNVFLEPERNENLELGVKWVALDGKLSLDFAVFDITKDNARVADPLNPGFNTPAGEQEVRGVSAGLTGRIAESLYLMAGISWLDGEQTNTISGGVSEIPNVAEQSLSVWADWSPLPRFSFGAGYRYLGSRFASNGKEVDGYGVIDAMAKFRLNQTVTFKLNLTNVTDQYYIDQIHPWHVVPGPGLGAVLAANLDF